MSRLSRAEVIDPHEVTVAHVISRTVRRCYLLGDDAMTGKNYDHRKLWIENTLRHFAAHFGIDLLNFAILSNHYHLIIRTRPDVVATWDDTEVARRWLMICPKRKIGGQPAEPSEADLNTIRRCPKKLAEIRLRLSNISWWMRLLNQRIAQRANREEEESGRFWRDRFRVIRLIDEESMLACAAYVDLNPIRAAIAETLETSDHTSIQRRIESIKQQGRASADSRRDAFLAPLNLRHDEHHRAGSLPSRTRKRCSDKGFLSLDLRAYLELLDWTARQMRAGKSGATPKSAPPVLRRLGLQPEPWTDLMRDFEHVFVNVAGRCDRLEVARCHGSGRRFCVRRRAKQLLPSVI